MEATVAIPETTAAQRLKMSYAAYLTYADEAKIAEWVNGEVITYMPSTDRHQAISAFLYELLSTFSQFFKLGILRYAPLEVKLLTFTEIILSVEGVSIEAQATFQVLSS